MESEIMFAALTLALGAVKVFVHFCCNSMHSAVHSQ